MSLQGSLETFALPDVLVLLASTKKNGELRVVGGKVDGRIWVEKGQIVHSDVNGNETSSVDAVFELLRLDAGSFSFDADNDAPSRHEPDTVDLVLADAQVRLGEWNDIARVVPHLDVLVDMAHEAPGDEVIVTAYDWKLLRQVAGGCTVAELMSKLGLGEFDTCKTVKRLADDHLVSVDADAKPVSRPSAPAPSAAKAEQAKDEAIPASVKVAPPKREPAPEAGARPAAKDDDAQAESDAAAELARLAEAAARPRSNGSSSNGNASKVRATTNAPGGPEAPEPAPPTSTASAKDAPPDDAKALVAQLAALGGENEEKIAKKVEEHLARGGELPEVSDGDEPINRGLLLKFLSSVRN